MFEAAVFVVFPLCLAVAAFSDMFTMTIPNRVSVILIVAFALLAPFSTLTFQEIAMHFGAGLIVFCACFALFAINVMGGGDAKLLTACALWFGFNQELLGFLIYASIYGGGLTILVMMLRSYRDQFIVIGLPMPAYLAEDQAGVPYGIAIGIAGFMTYPNTPFMVQILGGLG